MRLQFRGWVIQAGIGAISLAVGASVGYYLGKKRGEAELIGSAKKIEDLESEQLQLDFKRMELDKEFNFQIQQASHVLKELKETLIQLQGYLGPQPSSKENVELNQSIETHPSNNTVSSKWPANDERINEPRKVTVIPLLSTDEEDPNIMINVFPDENDVWDYDEEVKHRTPERPYIIHRDEFFSDEMDFAHATITFYEGDSILCDEDDVPIYNPNAIVGRLIFGHGSRDESICYVRNERLQAEYEVILDHGTYQSEILGNPTRVPDIKHSRRVPKFKRD